MRVRLRQHVRWQSLGIVALIIAPFLSIASAFFVYSAGIDRLTAAFVNPPYNTTTFLDVNYTQLNEMENVFEDRLVKYHMPLNFTCTTFFNPVDYDTPTWYAGGGDTAIQTGLGLATQCFRYATLLQEGNSSGADQSLEVVRRLMNGVSMLLAVPNGGIGPSYSGILARVVAPPNSTLVGPLQGLYLGPQAFNGSGAYSGWQWLGDTSRDQHAGVFFGLGMVLKFITDPDIRNLACLCVDQLIQGFQKTGWIGVDGTGLPTGVDISSNVIGDTEWMLCLLRLGATAYPDKYSALYYHFATSEMYLNNAKGGSPSNLLIDYYANTFNWDVFGTLLLLEDNPKIHATYIAKFVQPFWNIVRYQRNAYFDAMYAALTGDTNKTIAEDLGDGLMRFAIDRFPERNNNYTAVPTWYATTSTTFLDPLFKDNPFSSVFSSLPGVYNKFDAQYYTQPRTVDMMPWDWFTWQDNPFSLDSAPSNSTINNGAIESHGLAFTAPYWIGRWAGVINATGFSPREAFSNG
ncbi:MAG TPA: hypothetical protein VKK79_24785 [Candidatus Lokiarchaeia archaeon]|nr:hypothetical protein [Candidatus Lokiarchaeia archaeon]